MTMPEDAGSDGTGYEWRLWKRCYCMQMAKLEPMLCEMPIDNIPSYA